MKSMITTTLALAAVMMSFALPSEAADMMHKHKLECTACHTTGVGQPVPTSQCRTCHQAKDFEAGVLLKNGEANPHVPLHYEAATLDCALCHREHKASVNYCTACHADGLGFKVP